ncbi:MAG TPA: ABC transporter substrate-binding protein [Candidatus Binatia bacterium]|nr:ABC transporter substrate-binding protein [Candidatus Binatia bacterium]
MDRRPFLGALAAGLFAAHLGAEAQPSGKVSRIGLLGPGSSRTDPGDERLFRVFRDRLQELGYAEGRNVLFERRWPEGKPERLPQLAEELAEVNVDVIVAWSTPAVAAARRTSSRIPIIMGSSADAASTGLVDSYPHPGWNVTGVSYLGSQLATKWLQLMIELRPRSKRILALWDSRSAPAASARPGLETAAAQVQRHVDFVDAHDAGGYELAFRLAAERRADGVIAFPTVAAYVHRMQLAEAALKNRLPTLHGFREFVDAGGLLAYTPSQSEMARQAAGYVDRTIKGAKPGDLPVEQPTKYELIINLKTAKALGLTIPPSLLARADQVIE